jgi:hypothetical protein
MGQKMVLPDRIELSTSPLPMECSTTELRQHAPDTRIGPKGPCKAADPCHKAPFRASAVRAGKTSKTTRPGLDGDPFQPSQRRPRSGSPSPRRAPATPWPDREGIYFGRDLAQRSILSTVLNKPHDGFSMQDDDGKREGSPSAFAKNSSKGARKDRANDRPQDKRQDRLKLALRENLKRRKSQARGRGDPASASSNSEDPAPYDDGASEPDK